MIKTLAFGLGLLSASAAAAQKSEEVVSALSHNRVSITANFDGSEIYVVGAVKREEPIPEDSDLDVIVTVTGPELPVTVRKKEKRLGIWINTQSAEIDRAPSFYAVASTRSLKNILSGEEDEAHAISIGSKVRPAAMQLAGAKGAEFVEALVRIRSSEELYKETAGTFSLAEETLFGTHIALPANLVEGDYRVKLYLVRDGAVIDTSHNAIFVRKVGLGRWIYKLANEQPLAYGLLAVALAVATGWLASAAFRRLS